MPHVTIGQAVIASTFRTTFVKTFVTTAKD